MLQKEEKLLKEMNKRRYFLIYFYLVIYILSAYKKAITGVWSAFYIKCVTFILKNKVKINAQILIYIIAAITQTEWKDQKKTKETTIKNGKMLKQIMLFL